MTIHSFLKHCYVIALCMLSTITVSSQTGDPLLSHHTLDINGLDNSNFEMIVDQNGLLSIANRSGVLQYDGHDWDYFETPSAAVSIALDSADVLYVGCVSDFGYIGYQDNQYRFISLKDSLITEEIFFTTKSNDRFSYYLSDNKLVEFNIRERSVQHISPPVSENYFVDIFDVEGHMLVQTSNQLLEIIDGSLTEVNISLPDTSEILFFVKKPNHSEYLVGTSDNRLYTYINNEYKLNRATNVVENNDLFINDATWIGDHQFALSTIESGCYIFDDSKDSVVSVIDYHKGLPDNEIYAITTDRENGLWLAHEFGLTRIDNNIPINTFSNYPGIDGNLTGAIKINDQLFVSSSHGVFYLDSEHEYRNSVYYTLRKKPSKPAAQKQRKQQTNTRNEKRKKKRTFLRFGKRDDPEEDPEQDQNRKNETLNLRKEEESEKTQKGITTQLKKLTFKKSEKNSNKKSLFRKPSIQIKTPEKINGLLRNIMGKPTNARQYVRNVKREIIDTRYIYKSVDGMSSKAKQFLIFDDQLLVSGSSGVFEVRNQQLTQVIFEPVRYAHADKINQRLIVATYNNEVQIYEHINDLWVEIAEFEFYGETIISMLADEKSRIWLASPNKLYRLDSLDITGQSLPEYDIKNQYIDNVRLSIIDHKIYIINSFGYFYFDEISNAVVSDDKLRKQLGRPIRHLQESDGRTWVYNGKLWSRINTDGSTQSYQHLGLFPDMTFIDSYMDKLWVINDHQNFYQFNPEESDSLLSGNRMFYKDIRNKLGQVPRAGNLKFSYDNNSFQFELSRPDYLGLLNVEYQYKLEGMKDDWSEWSSNSKLDFNYLPPDRYILQVRSRDAFGNVQESRPFQFIIKPPYWQTLWFYAIQILIMVSMVILSIIMNRKAKTKYVLLTEGLTILTIVLIIEFLQTVAENYLGLQTSPVVDFLTDVGIALLVLPFEQMLKKLMLVKEQGPGISGKGILDFIPSRK